MMWIGRWLADKPDTVDVPLFAADFDLIDEALEFLARRNDAIEPLVNGCAELRDRLKRSRLLP